jgi:hypothetical protein
MGKFTGARHGDGGSVLAAEGDRLRHLPQEEARGSTRLLRTSGGRGGGLRAASSASSGEEKKIY